MTLSPATNATDATLHEVVPEAVPVPPVAAFVQVTCVTPTASEVVPPRAIGVDVVEYVGEGVGAVIVQTGAVTSGGV
jgi:hypothetical protein